jgi:NADPH:quinone reductase-like Zn-dependent oxidoreductase
MAATTRAIRIERFGAPDALVEREVPVPDPGPGEVHVRVHAAGVNFADLLMRAGLYDTRPPLPFSPGFEVAGEVVRAGAGVTAWTPGRRVVALIRWGGYARDIVVAERHLFPCPGTLPPAEAAAVPVVFLTAWVALFESARVRPGESVLVLTAGGGVGTAAVQLAVRHGCRVLGTAGAAAKGAFVTSLGAEACFDARGDWEGDVRRVLGDRGLDVALDALGGPATAACRRLLAPLGRVVFYGLSEAMPGSRRNWARAAWAWLRTPRFHPLALIQPNIGFSGIHLLHLHGREERLRPALETIYRDVEAKALRPVLDRVFPLTRDGAVEAHRYIHARRNLGKVVLARPADA